METILQRETNVICYFDDILVHSQKRSTRNTSNLSWTIIGLRLDPEKCEYRKSEVEFLGHRISKDGLRSDPVKLEAVVKTKDLKTPSNFVDC